MALPLSLKSGELGARARDKLPAASFSLELPSTYLLHHGGPDAMMSSQTFAERTSAAPAFTISRESSPDPEKLFVPLLSNAVLTRGERKGGRYVIEVRASRVATLTEVRYIRPTPQGLVFCGGYVDTPDHTAIGEWMVDRCASLSVKPK